LIGVFAAHALHQSATARNIGGCSKHRLLEQRKILSSEDEGLGSDAAGEPSGRSTRRKIAYHCQERDHNLQASERMKDFFEQRRPHNGHTYREYKKDWREQKSRSMAELDAEDRKTMHYLRYNWERAERVENEYDVSDELAEAVQSLSGSQLWMVITEPWCGDSAFCLPVIVRAAELNEEISVRILHRDDHLDIMDQYLTGGSRSIPKLVAFSEDGAELFQWGPRPDEAQALFDRLKDQGFDKMNIVEELIGWYEEGGYRHVDEELRAAIEAHVAA